MSDKSEPTALDYIGVGGSIGTSLLGMVHSDLAAQEQFRRQKELMKLENDYAISQWHRENEYNLPINQVQRLKEAGLNPALMYDNGTSGLVSGNVSNPTGGGNATKSDYHGAVLDPLTMAQIRNIDAQTENIQTDTDLKGTEAGVNIQRILNLRQEIRQSEYEINESAARIRNLDEHSKLLEAQRLNIKFNQVMRGKEWRDSHNKINAEIRRLNAGSALDERQFKEMCQTFVYRLTGLKLSNDLTQQQISHYTKLMDKLGIEITLDNQRLITNMPAYYEGKSVWEMHRSDGVVDSVGSSIYDGLSMFFGLFKGFLSFN